MEFASCSHWIEVVKPPWHKLGCVIIKDPAFIPWFDSVRKDKPHISQTNLIPNCIYVSERFPWQYIKLKEESFRKKHISNVIPHLGLCLDYIYFILTFCPGSSGKFFFFFFSFKKNPLLSLKATKPAEIFFLSPCFIQLGAPWFLLNSLSLLIQFYTLWWGQRCSWWCFRLITANSRWGFFFPFFAHQSSGLKHVGLGVVCRYG